ncbi:MAG: hypothetical protein IKE76_02670 [Clostridia bacterium]|nr:hypothetical protein [Clostridia bacterium]
MSGVYFQGMKMPEACNVCPAHHFYFPPTNFYDDEVTTTAVAVCMALGKELPTLSQENQKPDWCPAMFVPDHGRLGDLDRLLRDFQHDPLYPVLRKYNVEGWIAGHPTIIPGDKKEVSTDGESV